MKQTIEIEVPEGFEAKYNPDKNKIELVKKDAKARTWNEYYSNNLYKSHAFSLEFLDCDGDPYEGICLDSKEETDAFIALMKLRLLRNSWVRDWKPTFGNPNKLFWNLCYSGWSNNICYENSLHDQRILSFPTKEMTIEFMHCFEDLLEQAKMLL